MNRRNTALQPVTRLHNYLDASRGWSGNRFARQNPHLRPYKSKFSKIFSPFKNLQFLFVLYHFGVSELKIKMCFFA